MHLIMLGTGPFAVPTLRALAASRHKIELVITRPPAGRTRTASPVQQTAETLGIPVWSPDTVNSQEPQSRMASLHCDLLVVCDYGEILRPATLATTRLGGINLHGSLLPKYRGAAPIQWAILRGENETGNSIIRMTPGLDAGPLLAQQRTPIGSDEDAEQLETRLAAMGAELVLHVIDELESNTAKPIIQNPTLASKAPRLKKEHGAINWSQSAQEIKNQVRAFQPWPRAFTFFHRAASEPLRINIDRVIVDESTAGAAKALPEAAAPRPGAILYPSLGRLRVATGSGNLEVLQLQPAGKRSMLAAEFLRGHPLTDGDWFGLA
ncbi:MAG TPA: methionyl-tRNA formyltransferase [Lacipirellulaceae bacterium]|nr:methionyl-tRNA formyltransferase [Lacipirellulaceae bacterium]